MTDSAAESSGGRAMPSAGPDGLSPLRRRILAELGAPASASELARRLDLTRQRVNYHLRELERLGLVELVDERQRRGFVERRMVAVGRDRFSSGHLLAVASRLAGDVATLRERARAVDRRVLTFTLEVDVDFATPAAMREFADQLSESVRRLVARHHRPDAARTRGHRVVIGAHPAITKSPEQAAAEAAAHREAAHRGTTHQGPS